MKAPVSSQSQTLRIALNGVEYTFEIAPVGGTAGQVLQIMLNGDERRVVVHRHREPFLLLESEQADGTVQRMSVVGMAEQDQRQVWVNGRLLAYERIQPRRQTTGPAAAGALSSAIPAIVAQVLVSIGDEVQEGENLILLESMKMVIPIQAPYDGRIIHIGYAVGDAVPAGAALLEMEPATV
jgi:biotin carboxyl carrier protein